RTTLGTITAVADPEALKVKIAELSEQASAPDLWDDTSKAQAVTSALSHAQTELRHLEEITQRVDDLETLAEMAEEADDDETREEVAAELESLHKDMRSYEVRTLLQGEFDEREAVVTIRAGAGGVDAADFAVILLRRYPGWADRREHPAEVLGTAYAGEAGRKSVPFEVNVRCAYGNLSRESRTHRLVRISPFDNQGRRQ